jgi:putative acyl-CoA dehydrogenase
VEESIMPRLYREAPLNSIWEGSGNVICLDILRALSREPEAADALVQEIRSIAGADKLMDRYVAEIGTDLEKQLKQSLKNQTTEIEGQARRLAERFALALQAVQVMRHSPPAIAEAFIASRLGGDHGQTFGTLPRGLDLETVLDRSGAL